MRIAIISLVLLAQLAWVWRPLMPVVEYGMRYEYIKKVLCINKEVPNSGCNGTCYLKAQLAKQVAPAEEEPGVVPLAPQWESLLAHLPQQPHIREEKTVIRPCWRRPDSFFHSIHLAVPTPPPWS